MDSVITMFSSRLNKIRPIAVFLIVAISYLPLSGICDTPLLGQECKSFGSPNMFVTQALAMSTANTRPYTRVTLVEYHEICALRVSGRKKIRSKTSKSVPEWLKINKQRCIETAKAFRSEVIKNGLEALETWVANNKNEGLPQNRYFEKKLRISRPSVRRHLPALMLKAVQSKDDRIRILAEKWLKVYEAKRAPLTPALIARTIRLLVQENPSQFPPLRRLAAKLFHSTVTIRPLLPKAIELLEDKADETLEALIAKRRIVDPKWNAVSQRTRKQRLAKAERWVLNFVEADEIIPETQQQAADHLGISKTALNQIVVRLHAKTACSKGVPRSTTRKLALSA